MPLRDISPDPFVPLSAEEFRRAYTSWIKHYLDYFSDEELNKRLVQIQQATFDEAIRSVKQDVYKKVFWSIMSTLDLDP